MIVHKERLKRTFPTRYLLPETIASNANFYRCRRKCCRYVYRENNGETLASENIDEPIASETRSSCPRSFTKLRDSCDFLFFPALEELSEGKGRDIETRVFQVTLAGTEVQNSTRCYLSLRSRVSHQRCISNQLTTLFQLPLFV